MRICCFTPSLHVMFLFFFFSYKNTEDNSLVITSASTADSGKYICTAVNPAGEASKTMALFVQGLSKNYQYVIL
jgi:hypothetical protein